MSDDTRWARLSALFDAALTLSAEERGEWLAAACPDDAALRAEVVEMLDAHDRAGILDQTLAPAGPARTAVAPLHPAELSRRLEDALAERYIVERELGRGGAATVFLAHERKHARPVVLKVLNPEVAALYGHDRFEREVQIAARLSHPHILALIDSGDADGLLYFVMPHVEGETLRTRLDRRGRLPVGEALTLLRDVADALSYAHRAGVVHRDLKPANVLVAGEHAFLMDFGIAKLVTSAPGQGDLTHHGLALGTPAYMAPEQLSAPAMADPRTDLYAWGLLAHEMLAGTLPPAGDPDEARLALRAAHVPASLGDLVAGCLAADPRARPVGADAVLASLARLAAPRPPTSAFRRLAPAAPAAPRARRRLRLVALGIVALAGTVAGAAAWRGGRPAPPASAVRLASPVAVAVFQNETGEPALDSWGRLAGDWLTQGLQQTGAVGVVPWASSLHASELVRAERAQGRAVNTVARVAEETGAATVVTGSYYRIGDALQFRLEITDARQGRLLGAPEAVSAPIDSAHVVIRLLRDRLMGATALLADERVARAAEIARRPPAFSAYEAFDRGMQRYLAQDYAGSTPDFRTAFALDTTFLTPLVYAVNAYWALGEVAAVDSLLRIVGPRRGELTAYGRHIVASFEARLAGDGERALEALRQAVQEAPGSRATYGFAMVALETGHTSDALAVLAGLDTARGEVRRSPAYWTQLAHALHLGGDHERELAAARELRVHHPDTRLGLALEARALAALGRAAAIDSLLDAAGALPPTTYWSQGAALVVAGEELRAHGRAAEGERRLAQGERWLASQLELAPGDAAHRYWLGRAQYGLGRWADARRVFVALAAERPGRVELRGYAALAAARAGDPGAERRLGAAAPHERGLHGAFGARLAVVRGDRARAAAMLTDAVRAGVDGLPWLHASAWPELAPLARQHVALPASLGAR